MYSGSLFDARKTNKIIHFIFYYVNIALKNIALASGSADAVQ